MTDIPSSVTPGNGAGAQDQPTPPGIRILAQYIRDLSFENPRAPESLRAGVTAPQIELGVELNAQGKEGGVFEVELKLNVQARRETEAVFQIELVYAGLFQIVGVDDQDIEQVLMIECPRYLFPFARRMVADLTQEGGFPPLMLEPLDFAAIYLARQAQAAGQPSGTA